MSRRLFSDEQEAEIARRYGDGESSDALATAYGTNGRTVLNVLHRRGVALRKSASAGNPVVTAEQRARAVEMCRGGMTGAEAARACGVSESVVDRTLREDRERARG